eukprot:CAMPEP_0195606500 /NCGR_PEP_ID=MMETSP0815-20121206/7716_1 /TAXON_ID=97485 /ORGANISM="Prymnesium parvum, Strain Texoma1" /LENGTH=70 /DNA_ID=CAMNT_0040746241 /DNA_START=316 /DNA_END=525 /DNA_ORIENTATION=+
MASALISSRLSGSSSTTESSSSAGATSRSSSCGRTRRLESSGRAATGEALRQHVGAPRVARPTRATRRAT